ncbi:PE domain-containing protein [Mycobacterium uberis]|uniref:PE domain-containing protein n=1 Tax=Mycobacterium uberis TaxID=2162698 RepID=UPI000E308EC9|nr:PE domain-containing protein [Mycobacterium uberis]
MSEQIESTAHSLAGIRSTLIESSAVVAATTTAVVAVAENDTLTISVAVATLFGDFGREC